MRGVACSELAKDEKSGVAPGAALEAFTVDTGAICWAMRQKHIEALVRERFPPIGALTPRPNPLM